MASTIRLSKSSISTAECDAVSKVISEGYLGMGEYVDKFEKELQKFLNTTHHVIAVNTGTSALHLALDCLDIQSGDEVIVPTLTYVASFQAISATGAKPIACDVKPDTGLLDIDDARGRITSRTRAIMPVHYASNPAGMPEVYDFAKKFNLRVIEDAADSFGSQVSSGRRVGSEGDIVCFSFDGIKNITCAEGGAIITGDDKLASRIRDARLLGVERDSYNRILNQRSWDFEVSHQGYRYHMSNIMAAIGLVQLSRFDYLSSKRINIADQYCSKLKQFSVINVLDIDHSLVVPHIFPILLPEGLKDKVRSLAKISGIETGVHYKPNHILKKYKTIYRLPVAEQMYKHLLTLPLHPEIETIDIDKIISLIYRACSEVDV